MDLQHVDESWRSARGRTASIYSLSVSLAFAATVPRRYRGLNSRKARSTTQPRQQMLPQIRRECWRHDDASRRGARRCCCRRCHRTCCRAAPRTRAVCRRAHQRAAHVDMDPCRPYMVATAVLRLRSRLRAQPSSRAHVDGSGYLHVRTLVRTPSSLRVCQAR